ncbi:T6SS immunity protein Tli4 family protein [Pseudomonas sp. NPDC089534]|uniref:T6SS immunity protein Tli4 family protein n=1 Tax=Pseudomonas sp. NPDC089534 TaxID=3364468 RepID=UPI00381155C3
MTDLTRNVQTHCIGRLLIDLPEGTTWNATASSARLGDLTLVVETDVSQARYDELIEQRWQAVQAAKADDNGRPWLQAPERLSTAEGGTLFVYGFERVEGLAEDDETVVQKLFHQAEGYLWRDGTLFKVAPALNARNAIARLFPRLHARAGDDVPTRPGLCLSNAFVDGYFDPARGEQEEVSWGFALPRNLGLVVRHATVWEPGPSMLQRRREADKESAGLIARILAEPGVVAGRKEYRAEERRVGELTGEEYVMGGTEGVEPQVFKTNIGGEWDFGGRAAPSPLPGINLGMGTSFRTTRQPPALGDFPERADAPDGPTETEFFEVWDAIVESVRLRPSALTPPPPGGAPVAPDPVVSTVVSKPGGGDYVLEEFLTGVPPTQDWMDKL